MTVKEEEKTTRHDDMEFDSEEQNEDPDGCH